MEILHKIKKDWAMKNKTKLLLGIVITFPYLLSMEKEHKFLTEIQERAEELSDPSELITNSEAKSIFTKAQKLPNETIKKAEASLRKITDRWLDSFISSLPYKEEFKKALSITFTGVVTGYATALALVIAKESSGNAPTQEEINMAILEGIAAAGIDALLKFISTKDSNNLSVTPIANALIAGGRSLLVTPLLEGITKIPKTIGAAGKGAITNIIFKELERRGGLANMLKNLQVTGAISSVSDIESEYIKKTLATTERKNIERSHPLLVKEVEARIQEWLRSKKAGELLKSIIISAGIGSAIYYLLNTLGIMVPGLSPSTIVLIGAIQGILNYLIQGGSYVGILPNVLNTVISVGTIAAVPGAISSLSPLYSKSAILPATAYTVGKIAVDDVIGKSGGLINLAKDIWGNNILPSTQSFWQSFTDGVAKAGQALADMSLIGSSVE